MKGSKSTLRTNRKAVSLASSLPRRLHVSRFHHNIQVGLLPLIGQTSVLIPSHCRGRKTDHGEAHVSPTHHRLFTNAQHVTSRVVFFLKAETTLKPFSINMLQKHLFLFFSLSEKAKYFQYVQEPGCGLHSGGQQRGNIV